MDYELYPHRYADIILNSDYMLKQEVEGIIQSITLADVAKRYQLENDNRKDAGRRASQGMQACLNKTFKEHFVKSGWETEKPVFDDPEHDMVIDFWKRQVGVDVAFNHRSYLGGDLLRFQAAAEVRCIMKVGIYICATRDFSKAISPKDMTSMVHFDRAQWFLRSFYQVISVPVLLIGLRK